MRIKDSTFVALVMVATVVLYAFLAAQDASGTIRSSDIEKSDITAHTLERRPRSQDKPTAPPNLAPVLSEVDKLKVQTVAQRIQIAQLQAQAAQREFETARDEFAKLVTSLQKDGYELDLQSLSYRPKAVEKK